MKNLFVGNKLKYFFEIRKHFFGMEETLYKKLKLKNLLVKTFVYMK